MSICISCDILMREQPASCTFNHQGTTFYICTLNLHPEKDIETYEFFMEEKLKKLHESVFQICYMVLKATVFSELKQILTFSLTAILVPVSMLDCLHWGPVHQCQLRKIWLLSFPVPLHSYSFQSTFVYANEKYFLDSQTTAIWNYIFNYILGKANQPQTQ